MKKNIDASFCNLKMTKYFMKNIVCDCFIERKNAFMYIMFQK